MGREGRRTCTQSQKGAPVGNKLTSRGRTVQKGAGEGTLRSTPATKPSTPCVKDCKDGRSKSASLSSRHSGGTSVLTPLPSSKVLFALMLLKKKKTTQYLALQAQVNWAP